MPEQFCSRTYPMFSWIHASVQTCESRAASSRPSSTFGMRVANRSAPEKLALVTLDPGKLFKQAVQSAAHLVAPSHASRMMCAISNQ
jgi:hypothetical protein